MQIFRVSALFVAIATSAFCASCGGTSYTNVNANGTGAGNGPANSNTHGDPAVTLDNANLPPGFSTQPMTPPANVPGIPANGVAVPLPKGTTPTPGIPSPEQLKKGIKPGLTPTPGIPSPAEIKRMMANPANIKTAPPGNETPIMKMRPGRLRPSPTP